MSRGGQVSWGDSCLGGQVSGGTGVLWGQLSRGDSCPGGELSGGTVVLGGHLSRETNVGGTLVRGTNVTAPLKTGSERSRFIQNILECSKKWARKMTSDYKKGPVIFRHSGG